MTNMCYPVASFHPSWWVFSVCTNQPTVNEQCSLDYNTTLMFIGDPQKICNPINFALDLASQLIFNIFQCFSIFVSSILYLKHQIYLLTNQIVWLQHQVNFWRPHTDWITRWYMGPGFGFWNKALRWHPLPCSDDHHQKIIWISNELLTSFHWLNYKIMDCGFGLDRPKVALGWHPPLRWPWQTSRPSNLAVYHTKS